MSNEKCMKMWHCSRNNTNFSRSFHRLQEFDTTSDHCAQNVRSIDKSWRLFAVCNDVRQLPEAARLHHNWNNAKEIANSRTGGPTLLPSVLNNLSIFFYNHFIDISSCKQKWFQITDKRTISIFHRMKFNVRSPSKISTNGPKAICARVKGGRDNVVYSFSMEPIGAFCLWC